jgi:hypothetical protein
MQVKTNVKAGGKVSFQDLHFTTTVSKSSG